jgi:hypothetical protein
MLGDSDQVFDEGAIAVLPDLAGACSLEFGDDLACGVDLSSTAIGWSDQRGAAVSWVACAHYVSETLEVIDEVAHRLGRHTGTLGEIGQAHTLLGDVLEHGGVRRAQVIESSTGETSEDLGRERLIREPHRDADMAAPVADGRSR